MTELPIAAPCHEDWDAMRAEPGARKFCDSCTKHVHDLSSMTEPQARAVLAESRGSRICVRYRTDASGQLKFAADPVAPKIASNLVPVTALSRRAASSLRPAAALAVALAACTPHESVSSNNVVSNVAVSEGPARMGDVAMVEPLVPDEIVTMGEPPPMDEQVMMGAPPVEPEPAPQAKEEPAPEPQEHVLLGDVAWEPIDEPKPEPEPEAKPEPGPDPKPLPEPVDEVMGLVAPAMPETGAMAPLGEAD